MLDSRDPNKSHDDEASIRQPNEGVPVVFTTGLMNVGCLMCLSGQFVTLLPSHVCWAEARIKIARMTLTIKLDGNWSSFQLANSTPPLSVTGSAIAPSARMLA